jgi:hypothetical protein
VYRYFLKSFTLLSLLTEIKYLYLKKKIKKFVLLKKKKNIKLHSNIIHNHIIYNNACKCSPYFISQSYQINDRNLGEVCQETLKLQPEAGGYKEMSSILADQ